MVDRLPPDALDRFVDVAGANAQFPLLSIELRHLGGELRRPRPRHGALAQIDADYAMFAVGMVPAPEFEAPVRTQVQVVKDTLAPWAARHMYLNFAETQQDTASFWTEQAYDRLRRIKTAIDPTTSSAQTTPSARAVSPRPTPELAMSETQHARAQIGLQAMGGGLPAALAGSAGSQSQTSHACWNAERAKSSADAVASEAERTSSQSRMNSPSDGSQRAACGESVATGKLSGAGYA
jgi:Berberine and berberine like